MLEIHQYPNIDTCFYSTSAGKLTLFECEPTSFIFDSLKIKGEVKTAISVTFSLNESITTHCIKTLYLKDNEWVSADKQLFTNIIDAINTIEKNVTFKNEALFKDILKLFSKKYPEVLL
jgi:hypothetical protein